ncbi:MAG: pirin family protein [Bdellovibrionales bacterium]|nr:pirin family protein [Bdellovibrionales bacterium]
MKTLRESKARGYAQHGWLKSYHTFSFADYYDNDFMGFSSLRVINEDFIEPSMGFPLHGHRNMEIVTLVLEGAIEHKDILGNSEVVPYGHVQRMSAGSGIRHSEFNPSTKDPLHLLQIWIEPNETEVKPRYDRKDFTTEHQQMGLKTLVSGFNEPNTLSIYQKARISHGLYAENSEFTLELSPESNYWLQMVKGQLLSDNLTLNPGDGLALSQETLFKFKTQSLSEFYLFQMLS